MTDLGSRFAQAEEKDRKKQLIFANLLIVDTLSLSWYFVLVKLLKALFILDDNKTDINLLANLLLVDTLYLSFCWWLNLSWMMIILANMFIVDTFYFTFYQFCQYINIWYSSCFYWLNSINSAHQLHDSWYLCMPVKQLRIHF